MKLLFDLFPVILFFVAFKYSEKSPELAASWVASLLGSATVDLKQAPILLATIVVIAATVAQIVWVRLRHGKVDKMLWVSLALVSIFGSLTLIFQNEAFIKWKPTILYWVFAGSIAFSSFILKKNAIKAMLGEQLTLPESVWNRLSLSWVAFFLFMGCLNLFVAFNFSTDTWVNFKLFGGMGLLFVFIVGQGLLLSKYVQEEK
ncbi:septation protein A [Quatrionicoccus australiensis]|uniref:septation protein A n=1 Tax=Quatrionicoccus australiensis TaxID=138118 RepID=UPI001CFA7C91|nr:septation protein A [Quatrionicoccus australiensis]MCB4361457.1 septation protein A [Quatrionicoccus australiensis]